VFGPATYLQTPIEGLRTAQSRATLGGWQFRNSALRKAAFASSVVVIHKTHCRSRSRLPIAIGAVSYETSILSMTQDRLVAGAADATSACQSRGFEQP
jgi:hypothetical protein